VPRQDDLDVIGRQAKGLAIISAQLSSHHGRDLGDQGNAMNSLLATLSENFGIERRKTIRSPPESTRLYAFPAC
jgi:hypothetical protein